MKRLSSLTRKFLIFGAILVVNQLVFAENIINTKKIANFSSPAKPFIKYKNNPIMSPQGIGFESAGTFNPAVILKDDIFYMFYRAQNKEGQSSIGLARSTDGINFGRNSKPIITPEFSYELPGGCEDPRIMRMEDTYYMTYTGFSAKGTPSCLAISKDLITWKKYGPIVPKKSAAILNKKINGEYWLYFGDTNIWIAHSADMINWKIIDTPVMRPRAGYFDGGLVESGPPPIVTKDGILLIYNGNIPPPKKRPIKFRKKTNQKKVRDYATGWVLFSIKDPSKIIARCEKPFLTVTENFEKFGQVGNVVFSEGLVEKNSKAYLYYGAADTYIGLAMGKSVPD